MARNKATKEAKFGKRESGVAQPSQRCTARKHYREKELGPNCSKTRKTQVAYEVHFNKWILPRWGSYRVTDVKAVAVEQGLRSLQYANGSKAKARNIMSAVFTNAA
jgi:hypothetical protein